MIKIGSSGINMGEFTNFAKIFLGEAAKYVLLLLFVILAIRLWRRTPAVSGKNRKINSLLAATATIIAAAIGYFSFRHSMGRLYSHYGVEAFQTGHPAAAVVLFSKSCEFWNNTEALGNEGVCLLWAGHPNEGVHLLDRARTAQGGTNSAFQNYYEGLYLLYNGQTDKASSLLEAASASSVYRWNVIKLFATLNLDHNQTQEAENMIKPFKDAPVTETDQAYVMASLDLIEGKKSEAQAVWQKFNSTNLPPFWQTRFDKLGAKIQNQNP